MGSFYARHFSAVNGLRTTGILVASGDQIVFAPVVGFSSESSVIDDRISKALGEGLTPSDILDDLVESSDSLSSSISMPRTFEAMSMNDAAIMMLGKVEKEYVEVTK